MKTHLSDLSSYPPVSPVHSVDSSSSLVATHVPEYFLTSEHPERTLSLPIFFSLPPISPSLDAGAHADSPVLFTPTNDEWWKEALIVNSY